MTLLMAVGRTLVGGSNGPPGGVTDNLVVWIEADQQAYSDGASVSSYADTSGNANNAVQATGAKQPTFHSSSGPNGKPSVTFDGGDCVVAAAPALGGTQAVTLYLVASAPTPATTEVILEYSNNINSGSNGFGIFRDPNGTVEIALHGDSGYSTFVTSDTLYGDAKLISSVIDKSLGAGNEINVWLNGAYTGGADLSGNNDNAFSNVEPLNIGARNNGASFGLSGGGHIPLVMIYSVAHDATTRQAIESAIGAKYGLF